MDTPERSKIGGTPLSKFEDSPIFNFINNLSPIQPVKSAHGTQVFHSLSYASISSVFSSPHINLQKESRFLIRHSDSSKLEISSDSLDQSNLCSGIPDADNPAAARENCNIICLLNKASVDPPEECSTQPSNLPQPIQYDCSSPNHNTKPCYSIKVELKSGSGQNPDEVTKLVHDGVEKRKILFDTEFEVQGEHQCTQNSEEVSACVWENLISEDADDLLIFDSPANADGCTGQDEKFMDNDATFLMCPSPKPQDITEILQTTESDVPFGPCLQATQFPPPGHNEEVPEHQGTDHTPQILSSTCQNQVVSNDQNKKTGNGPGSCISVDCKVESHQQRGMRRRCLTFELANNSTKNSNPYLPNSLPLGEKLTSNDKKSLSLKPGSSSSTCILPSIGLHLNTLATTPKDGMVTKETFAFGKRLISMPCTISPFPPISASQRFLSKSMDVEKDPHPIGSEAPNLEVTHDDYEAPEFDASENLSQSPKKKRKKSENGGESEACKRCNCKKSKCLKLYCECFAAGIYCVEPCSCQGCFNKPIHEETVLATRKQIESRNPLAFAPKVIRASEPVQEVGEEANKTPASARHKRGCNCKKSSCLKKYCECYQGGVGCSPSCRCEGCKNAFGRKNAEEVEPVEEGLDGCEKQQDRPQEDEQIDIAQKSERHSSKNIEPLTPFEICRPSVKLPFHSSGKSPRSSSRSIGFPSGPTPQTLRRCEFPLLQTKLIDRFKNVPEDDTPEILKGDTSSNNGVKTVSPNGKRVSPPHNALGISPNRKGGRKLILKSIPSFPSLNSDVSRENPMEYSSSPFNSSALN